MCPVVSLSLMNTHWSHESPSSRSKSHDSPLVSVSLMSPDWSPIVCVSLMSPDWSHESPVFSHESPLVS